MMMIDQEHMHNLLSLFSSQVKQQLKIPQADDFIVTSHWWQLDRLFFNGSSKYRRWIHNCSKSNLHHCHFNLTLRQSTYQRYRGEPQLLKISLLSASEVVQLLRENRVLSRTEMQEEVYLLLRAELFCSTSSLTALFNPKGKLPHLFSSRENLIWLNETTSVILTACELHVMVGNVHVYSCVCSLYSLIETVV